VPSSNVGSTNGPERSAPPQTRSVLRLAGATATAATVALAVAACGSGSSPSVTPNFVAKANAICMAANTEVADLVPATSLKTSLTLLKAGLTIDESELAQLNGLTAPSNKQAVYTAELAVARKEITLIKEVMADEARGDSSAVQAVSVRAEKLTAAVDPGLVHIGLYPCTVTPVPSRRS